MSQEYCIECDSKMMYDDTNGQVICPNCYCEDFYYKESEEL